MFRIVTREMAGTGCKMAELIIQRMMQDDIIFMDILYSAPDPVASSVEPTENEHSSPMQTDCSDRLLVDGVEHLP